VSAEPRDVAPAVPGVDFARAADPRLLEVRSQLELQLVREKGGRPRALTEATRDVVRLERTGEGLTVTWRDGVDRLVDDGVVTEQPTPLLGLVLRSSLDASTPRVTRDDGQALLTEDAEAVGRLTCSLRLPSKVRQALTAPVHLPLGARFEPLERDLTALLEASVAPRPTITQVEARLTGDAKGGGRFDVRLAWAADNGTATATAQLSGTVELSTDGRVRAVTLRGPLATSQAGRPVQPGSLAFEWREELLAR
jgi:hypothetical protein